MPSDGYVSISFQYAAQTKDKAGQSVDISTNGMRVLWNKVHILNVISTDPDLHQFKFLAKAVQGSNTLLFIGAGKSDGLGMTVDNVNVHQTSNIIKN